MVRTRSVTRQSSAAKQSSAQKAATRATSAVVMASILAGVFYAGHRAVCLTVCICGGLIYRELVNVRYKSHGSRIVGKVPRFRTVQWLWFAVGLHFAYGSDVAKAPMGLGKEYLSSADGYSFPNIDHTVLSFALYSAVFVITVVSLTGTEEELRFQISQLCWSIAAICLTVFQMKFSVANTFHGLFWIVFPGILVACNDTGAYISGKSCGKKFTSRTFFPLSPNKTWEGFVGAAIMTCACGFVLPLYLARSDWLRCSYMDLESSGTCDTSVLFTPASTVGTPFGTLANVERFGLGLVAPIQIHGVIMGLFASLVAPFGGLFASVVKRAYGLKDFDNLIPGHGGFMDRMDCQMVMILFTYVYLTSFVLPAMGAGGSGVEHTAVGPAAAAAGPTELFHSIAKLEVADRNILLSILKATWGVDGEL